MEDRNISTDNIQVTPASRSGVHMVHMVDEYASADDDDTDNDKKSIEGNQEEKRLLAGDENKNYQSVQLEDENANSVVLKERCYRLSCVFFLTGWILNLTAVICLSTKPKDITLFVGMAIIGLALMTAGYFLEKNANGKNLQQQEEIKSISMDSP